MFEEPPQSTLDSKIEPSANESHASDNQTRTKEPRKRYESPQSIKSPEEDILATGTIKLEKEIIGVGEDGATFITFEDGTKSVFKEQGRREERATYLIDRFLGLNIVPPTVLRQLGVREGSMQEFIPNARTARELNEEEAKALCDQDARNPEMIRMWLLDVIIGNPDRHKGNLLIDEKNKIHAIDHSRAFDFYHDFAKELHWFYGRTQFNGEQMPEEIVNQMKKFLEDTDAQSLLKELLSELFPPDPQNSNDIAAATMKRILHVAKVVTTGIIPKNIVDDNIDVSKL